MSTAALTISVAVAVLFGTAVSAVRLIWVRKAAEAAFLAGGFFGILHLLILWVAEDAALSATINQERWPGIADLSTWMYDITAWTALVLLTAGVIGGIVRQIRRRRRQEAIERYFEHLSGLYEAEGE